jgi:hypothetical protein
LERREEARLGCPRQSFNIHAACDPNVEFAEPGEEDRRRYGVAVSRCFDSKAERESLMSRYLYFFAPRLRQGIGFTFLDAMALGMVVITQDDATWNEYSKDGEKGYLYSVENPLSSEFEDYKAVRDAYIRRIAEGAQGMDRERAGDHRVHQEEA